MAKKYDLVIKNGEYQKDGETKTRWQNVGVVMEGENGPYILLDRTFNPAGLPNPENRNNVIISMFQPKGKDEAPAQKTTDNDDIPF
jgi:hypothetical protein